MLAISARGMTKAYGNRTALAGLDLSVPTSLLYGFLGPNGAGKSTALRILTGVMQPDQGEVKLFGAPLRPNDPSFRRRIGIVHDQQHLPTHLSALEYLRFFAKLFEVEGPDRRADQLLDRVGLRSQAKWPAARLSHGQQQKLAIARSLLHDPDLLFWDEPISGLDAQSIREIRDLLLELKQRGRTLVFSSHILSEVERTADRVGILAEGRLVAEGTLPELQQRFGTGVRLEIEVDKLPQTLIQELRGLPFVQAVEAKDRLLQVVLLGSEDRRAEVASAVGRLGATVIGLRAEAPSLEELFLRLTPGQNQSEMMRDQETGGLKG